MMKRLARIAGLLVAVLVMVLIAVLALRGYLVHERLKERPVIATDIGVDELFAAPIGGVKQWLHIRGHSTSNPVLLIVHGGPGSPMMPYSNMFQHSLEQHFTVVHWDQRGAGKTGNGAPADSYSESTDFGRMVDDGIEVTELLRQKFGQQRIVLLGHSWGSMLGHAMVMKRPDYYSVWIGVGVVVHGTDNDLVAIRRLIEIERAEGNDDVVSILQELIDTHQSNNASLRERWKAAGVMVRHLNQHAIGFSRRYGDMFWWGLWDVMGSPEYSLPELLMLLGVPHPESILRSFYSFDAKELGTNFEMPVIYALGRHDWLTPSTMAADFLQHRAEAPTKKIIWFEQSAHNPFVDEPDEVVRMMLDVVRPLAIR